MTDRNYGSNQPAGREVVAVLGCYRGGTSAVARVLPVIGVPLVGRMLAARGCNPTGFWENEDILELNLALAQCVGMREFYPNLDASAVMANAQYSALLERGRAILESSFTQTSIVGFKHPGTSRLLFFWQEVFHQTSTKDSYLIALRHPGATAESLRSNFHLRIELGLFLWLEHLISAVQHTHDRPRVIVGYELLLAQPRQQVLRAAAALGREGKTDPKAVDRFADGFIDQSLQHSEFGTRRTRRILRGFPIIAEVYRLMQARAADQVLEEQFQSEFKILILGFEQTIADIFHRYPWLSDQRLNKISKAEVLWFRLRHEGLRSTLRRVAEHGVEEKTF